MIETRFTISDYQLKQIKDCVSQFRVTYQFAGQIEIRFPISAESSMGFIEKCYPIETVRFILDLKVKDKDLLLIGHEAN